MLTWAQREIHQVLRKNKNTTTYKTDKQAIKYAETSSNLGTSWYLEMGKKYLLVLFLYVLLGINFWSLLVRGSCFEQNFVAVQFGPGK